MKVLRGLSLLTVVVLAGMLLGNTVVSAKPIELSLSLMTPPKHLRNIHVIDPWVKMVEERTKGAVKINIFYSSTLAPPAEMFDSTASGVIDISESYTFGNPGRFPITETLMLPELGFKTSLSCSNALWHLYKTLPEMKKEYAGVKMLWLHVTPGARLMTKKKPIRSIEDLKGLKISVSGATAVKNAKALGFTPVTMSTADIYEAQEKGVIDGFVRPVELLVSRKLSEVTKYVTDVDLGHDTFFLVMNQKSWDKLPPDVQKAFGELTGDWAVDFTGKAWDKFDKDAEKEMKGKVEFISLSSQELARWKKLLAPIKEEYAAELAAKKLPDKKIFDELRKLAQKSNP